MKISKPVVTVIAALASVYIMLALAISTVVMVFFDTGIYNSLHREYSIDRVMGMEQDDLDASIKTLMDYVSGKRDDITISAPVNGINREIFTADEYLHMKDVRGLYEFFMAICWCCWALGIALMALVLILTREKYIRRIAFTFMISAAGMLVLIGGLAFIGSSNFDAFWPALHGVLFTNDLWLLDPRYSLMIQMLPGELFDALIMRIGWLYVSITAALCALAYGGYRYSLVRAQKKEVLSPEAPHTNDSEGGVK